MLKQSSYTPAEMVLICQTPDVRVTEITLAPRSDTPVHEHTEAEEICYCLDGELTCEIPGERPHVMQRGDRKTFPAGRPHRLSNLQDAPCKFLLIHSGGAFDFVAADS